MRLYFLLGFVLFMAACSPSYITTSNNSTTNKFGVTETTSDETYGYTEKNPVKVGGAMENGVANERKYLSSLTGPKGEEIKYERIGNCCPFKTPNGPIDGTAMLDKYKVSYKGLSKPVIIYINMYDKSGLQVPKGFLYKE